MNRRVFLSSAGAIVLAGCPADGDQEGSDNGTDEAKGIEENDEVLNETYEHLETAGEELETQAELSFETDPNDSLSISGIETGIENAEAALADFDEDSASDEQLARFKNSERAIVYLKDAVAVLVELENGINALDTAVSYENNERFADAADQMEVATDHFVETESLVDDVATSWDELNAEQFGANNVDLATGADDIDHLKEICNAYARFSEAGIEFYLGVKAYFEGTDLFGQERFSAASSAFSDASDNLGTANQRYKNAETNVPQSFQNDFIEMTCLTDALHESSVLFAEASDAAENRDWETAETRAEEAEAALDVSCGERV
ncbi:hypothetical protein [Halomontanus rarus]|uniref:hypothetical protein n=1 Tax=Halomontanus rarus TaxID=3034020 RepID=UPI00293BED4C|nr:hypothetical protein [Halovivax sp. KZCA124]